MPIHGILKDLSQKLHRSQGSPEEPRVRTQLSPCLQPEPGLSEEQITSQILSACPHARCQGIKKGAVVPRLPYWQGKPSVSHQPTYWGIPQTRMGINLEQAKNYNLTYALSYIIFPIKNVPLNVMKYIFYKRNCAYLSSNESKVSSAQDHWITYISPVKSLSDLHFSIIRMLLTCKVN